MAKYTYNDIVTAKSTASPVARPGEKAWVIAVLENRTHFPLKEFPPGVVYTVEFEGGDAVNIHEDDLEIVEKAD